jgi:hypothetical protein
VEDGSDQKNLWWVGPAAIGWIQYRDLGLTGEVAKRGDASLMTLAVAVAVWTAHDGPLQEQCGLEEAKHRLIVALNRGQLIAQDEHGAPIPLRDWGFMRFTGSPFGTVPTQRAGKFGRSYGQILLPSDDVMRLWPSTVRMKAKSVVTTGAAIKTAIQDLAKQLTDRPEMTLAEAIDFCRRHGVSPRQVRIKVWPDARELATLPRLAPPGRKRRRAMPAA